MVHPSFIVCSCWTLRCLGGKACTRDATNTTLVVCTLARPLYICDCSLYAMLPFPRRVTLTGPADVPMGSSFQPATPAALVFRSG
jgi:hypothetical protein